MPHKFSLRPGARPALCLFLLAAGLALAALPARFLDPLRPAARAATTFTVNSAGDAADTNTADGVCDSGAGACTLRAAIEQANATSGADEIRFAIGSGLQTVALTTDLPIISDPVTIDGTTQPGFAGTPLIELNGTNAQNRAGLTITGGNSVVRGLVLNRFNTTAIALSDLGHNRVEGNYIGTDAAGTARLPNGFGISIFSPDNVVGGTTAAARNVISGNNGSGVEVGPFSGNVIQGNLIGTNASGTAALFNGGVGVRGGGSTNTTIGGTAPGAGNVISGNGQSGIEIGGQMTTVQGNLIGTNAAGTAAVRNGGMGVRFSNSPHNLIGGTTPGARNVISGNFEAGLGLEDGTTDNVVRGNFIGTDITGVHPIPNSPEGFGAPNTSGGVWINRSSDNTIGGSAPGEGNVIAFNGAAGVRVLALPSVGVGNHISRNSVYGNLRPGIDLGPNGVTPNDAGDADGDANNLQNFPLVAAVVTPAGITAATGSLSSAPHTSYTVEVFSSHGCHPSGHGEGARFVGAAAVTTDAAGNANFEVALASPLPAGRVLTATASDPAGNTSEFSPCTTNPAAGVVRFARTTYRVREDIGAFQIEVVRTGGSAGPLTVNYATQDDTALAGSDYTAVSGTLTFADGETSKTIALPVTNDAATEGSETLFVKLHSPDAPEAVGGSGVTVVRIFDGNFGTLLEVVAASVNEGDSGATNVSVTVALSIAIGQTVTVDYTTAAMTATSGVDFQPVSGNLTFSPGVTSRTVTVPVLGDRLDEPDETFRVALSNPVNAGLIVSSNPPTVLILDDDPTPALFVDNVGVVEGSGDAVFTVSLSAPSGRQVSVSYATADGTAAAGSDYTAAAGMLFFNPGETAKTVPIAVHGDGADEPLENFLLNLSAPSNASLADGHGVATIGSASSPAVRFAAATFSVGEADHAVEISVTRAGDTAAALAVEYASSDGTASERADYTAALGALRFDPGETTAKFTVLVNGDAFNEGAETVRLTLGEVTAGAFVAGSNTALLTITDVAPGPGNPADETAFYVRQHYHDFLNREPDADGLAFWSQGIESCGMDAQCRQVKRVDTSAAFFLSIEFQETGYLVYRMYKAAFGDINPPTVPVPVRLREFLGDTQEIGRGVEVGVGDWVMRLENNKRAFAESFVARQRFLDAYPPTMSPAEFVAKLNQHTGGALTPAEADALAQELAAAGNTPPARAVTLRKVAENGEVARREFNRAFVLMQYFGYLRRDPDSGPDAPFGFAGYNFWLDKLTDFAGDWRAAEMVRAFIESIEYRQRFGQ